MTPNKTLTLDLVKRAYEVGGVQPHQLWGDDIQPDLFQGQSAEHDNLVAAFSELHRLDKNLREQARAIFERRGLSEHGFAASVTFHYVPQWDKHLNGNGT
jgi:hypothetical protein